MAVIPGAGGVRVIEWPESGVVTGREALLRGIEAGTCGTHHEIGALVYGTPPDCDRRAHARHQPPRPNGDAPALINQHGGINQVARLTAASAP
ncbi:hypothetical protein [Actinomadura sp. HBU206391]|uniref:hypothetical protein n=1 Tax=Actinomadura sp. HBU206391 TaxID=2731692 RepID=UPI00164F824A|nr:hypothetical protein [Actinomadura sp. HBU206391]MBC6463156.1 hypothetical protein [Actinomadura sp. HBU206391]